MISDLIWCEINSSALKNNIKEFRKLVGEKTILAPVVKGNAYGHGLLISSRAFIDGGAQWLCVNDLKEAKILRDAGINIPVYILGYVPPSAIEDVGLLKCRIVLYDFDVAQKIALTGKKFGVKIPVHLKLETGTNRQGLKENETLKLAKFCVENEGIYLEGLSTHFADIEDTTDLSFAESQMRGLLRVKELIEKELKIKIPIINASNTAATINMPESHLNLARVGIGAYGMWPSKETYISALIKNKGEIKLNPAIKWKTIISQLKELSPGEFIGYGRTFKTTSKTKIAVLPVGYYDGYDRKNSNISYVLVKGRRAPLRGRVCMNMIMIDVSDIPDVKVGDEVILLGNDGDEKITAEDMAGWVGTINYEITTRIAEHIPRKDVEAKNDA